MMSKTVSVDGELTKDIMRAIDGYCIRHWQAGKLSTMEIAEQLYVVSKRVYIMASSAEKEYRRDMKFKEKK
jgi:hypothetical protein